MSHAICRQRMSALYRYLEHHITQYLIVILSTIDVFLVIAVLLINVERCDVDYDTNEPTASHVLHLLHLVITCIFAFEMLLRIISLRVYLVFKSRSNLFDVVLVAMNLVITVIWSENGDALDSLQLMGVLRLWRLRRIYQYEAWKVRKEAELTVAKEVRAREKAEYQLQLEREARHVLQREVSSLTAVKNRLENQVAKLRRGSITSTITERLSQQMSNTATSTTTTTTTTSNGTSSNGDT
eukprot:Colp12_sorted_trinity150504_noHs@25820